MVCPQVVKLRLCPGKHVEKLIVLHYLQQESEKAMWRPASRLYTSISLIIRCRGRQVNISPFSAPSQSDFINQREFHHYSYIAIWRETTEAILYVEIEKSLMQQI